ADEQAEQGARDAGGDDGGLEGVVRGDERSPHVAEGHRLRADRDAEPKHEGKQPRGGEETERETRRTRTRAPHRMRGSLEGRRGHETLATASVMTGRYSSIAHGMLSGVATETAMPRARSSIGT